MRSGHRTSGWREIRGMLAGALGVLAACRTRDRLAFPDPVGPPGDGPHTTIDVPMTDTTVPAGPGFVVSGRTIDLDGIDTLYFETEGGVSGFPPFTGGDDTVRFGLPLSTTGQTGVTITVRVFGTDMLGNRGDTATRRISVQ